MNQRPKLLRNALGLLCLVALFNFSYAQEKSKIKGVVIDSRDRTPLAGATITQVGGPARTMANDKGVFELNVAPNSKLQVSMTGYETQTIKAVNGMTVTLSTQANNMEEVVVIGYTTQKKEMLTGSVATVKVKQSDIEVPVTNAGNLLAGRMAGVNVSTPRGLPGAQPGISIRTAGSINPAPVLYVIDGRISSGSDFNNLSPNEIADITALKDAATTAVYGARGAGGVILVTTKRGSSGRATISYSVNAGYDKRGKNMDLTNILEWGSIYNRINGQNGQWTSADSTYYANTDVGGGKGYGFNLLKDVYRDASTTTHNLSVSGGSDKVKYFIGGSIVKQQTFVKNTDFKKYNLRANITADVTKDISVFASIGLNQDLTSSPRATLDGDIYTKSLVWQPFFPSFTASGLPFDFGWITSVAGEMQGLSGYNNSEYIKPTINVSATYKVPFVKGLSAKASYAKSYTNYQNKLFSRPFMRYQLKQISPSRWDLDSIVGSSWTQNTPQLQQVASWSQDNQLNLQLSYDRYFAEHHVSGTVVYESAEAKTAGVNAWITGFPLYTTDQWWAATTSPVINGSSTRGVDNGYGSQRIVGRRSWAGQFFYDYAAKYLASFTYRYDGSMNFAPDKRWGFFPAASAGWIISKENFFAKLKGIDMLKLRGSVGLTGNDTYDENGDGVIDEKDEVAYRWQDFYKLGASGIFGTQPALNPGLQYSSLPNPDITWEKYLNKNIGIDINFLKHWNASIEYWHNYTYDILGVRIGTTPPTFSRTLPAVNYGKMKSKGVDLSVGYTNRLGNVNFNAGAVASYGYAWRTQIDQNVTYDYQDRLIGGRAESRVVGYVVDHMIRTQKDLDEWNAANPKYRFNGAVAEIGQFVYKDLGSNKGFGVTDSIIDQNDVAILRKRNNPVVVGLNLAMEWKGFSISANFNGALGYSKFFTDLAGGVEWNRMWRTWATDAWSLQTPNAWLPRRYSANDNGHSGINTQNSNFWLADASFLRLKALNIAYVIPQKLYSKYVSSIRLYASGSNLFIISKYNKRFYDPEMNGGTSFPIVKSYNAGCTITF